ncbi:MAG: LytR C-terminal domain-containing protein [Actinomycetota bacterium]
MRHSVTVTGRYVANTIVLIAVMLSPFVAYKVVKAVTKPSAHPWPADVVLIGSNGGQLSSFSLLRMQNPLRIDFPTASELQLASGGALRAATIYKVGGAKQLADALASTLTISNEYFAEWNGGIGASLPTHTDLGTKFSDVENTLATPSLIKIQAPGHMDNGTYFSSFVLDTKTLGSELSSQSPEELASATPSPSSTSTPLKPQTISIEVINQGAHNGAGTQMVQALQAKGFTRTKLAQPPTNTNVTGNYIFFAKSRLLANVVEEATALKAKITRTPATYDQSVDVVVLLGVPAPTS